MKNGAFCTDVRSNPTKMDAGAERLLEESLERQGRKQDRRERAGNLCFAAAFLLASVAMAVLCDASRDLTRLHAVAFVIALAVVARVEVWGGSGYYVPTQIVFVPMLLLLPTPLVPLLVAAGLVLARASPAVGGRADARPQHLRDHRRLVQRRPGRRPDPAGAQLPDLAHWPAYAGALAAQVVTDGAIFVAWAWVCQRVSPRDVLADLAAPTASTACSRPSACWRPWRPPSTPLSALLVLPLAYLLLTFSRERESRMRQSLELSRAYRGTALLLRDLLEEDDEYTGRHTEDVVGLTVRVAEQMQLDEDTCRAAEMGALLHDIGKIAVPDEIINKPGPLNDEEWAIMKTHTVEGERMLKQVGGLLADVGLVVRASHERWDGGGYPDGLVGEAIPVAARIVSACDAFNAMTTDRSYRKALPLATAVGELRRCSGTQFDPAVVDALVSLVDEPEAPAWELSVAQDAAPAAAPQLPAPRKA